jgi:predicted O-linked N-acetylglucosamine transferase (SPINDLY family)
VLGAVKRRAVFQVRGGAVPGAPAAVIARGLEHHRAGRLAQAEAAYREALAQAPEQPEALHLLGVLAYQVGRHDLAEPLIRRALVSRPGAAEFHNNLGNVLWAQARAEDAIGAYRRALTLAPRYVDAHANLGNVFLETGRLTDAERHYREALRREPDRLDALTNLANVLARGPRAADAMPALERALGLAPASADVHLALSRARLAQADATGAETSARRAAALRPSAAHAHAALGNALLAQSAFDEAHKAYRRALELGLKDGDVHVNLGSIHLARGRLDEATASYTLALSLSPDSPEANNGLGHVLTRRGQLGPAIALFERALTLRPDYVAAHNNLAAALAAQGRIAEAIAHDRRAVELAPADASVHTILVFDLEVDPQATRASIFAERRRWNDRHARALTAGARPHDNDPDPERRLRVGYVSSDFRVHSAAAVVEGVLRHHDPAQFQVACYSGSGEEDEATERFRAACALWRPTLGVSDEALADRIREDGIDILVDLTAHSGGCRLLTFARKPAPVQVSAWGYAVGTGLDAIDYFFGDPIAVPPEARAEFSEEVIDLPCMVSFAPPTDAPAVAPPPLRERGAVTFGCFNRLAKVPPEALTLWAEILRRVPDARLAMKFIGLDDPATRERVLGALAARGVDADRLLLLGGTNRRRHLEAYAEVDLALDPFPHGGGVSALEGLWMGVPMVPLLGDRVAGRIGASILTALGLPDFIATTPDDYVERAVRLAGDVERLAALRAGLRDRLARSVLCDHRAYTSAVEAAYRTMWRGWCATRPSRS